MRAPLLLLLSTWCLAGCGDNDIVPDLPDGDVTPEAVPPSLQERIDAAVAHITADTCFAQSDTSGCEWAHYEVGRNHHNMAVSTGEAVLVVDGFGEGLYPQFVRYRNRILGFYRVNGQTIEAKDLSVRLPKRLGDTLVSFAGPEFIPSSQLTMVGKAASATYRNVPLLFLGHGGVIFSHLAELTPEQPLVLLDLTKLVGLLPSLCAGVNAETLASASAHFTAIASSLKQLMRAHNVRFVNASFGDTVATITRDWMSTCGTALPSPDVLRQLLHLYDPIYDTLFNTEGVITAHAAANLGDPADYPFDQVIPRYANRVRVGFISSLSSGLDEWGRGTVQQAEQYPRNGDADVYLNWGCEAFVACADPHYEGAGSFGLSSFTVVLMSSSYINPLGLGRLINLRYANHGGEPMSNALVQTLRQELVPPLCGQGSAQPCRYQDPIAHRQLEVYRRNYR